MISLEVPAICSSILRHEQKRHRSCAEDGLALVVIGMKPHETALQQLRLFFLTHRRIRGDLISMFKITHGLLKFHMESTCTRPIRKGLRGHAYKFHQQRCCARRRHYVFTIRAVLFWNKLPTKTVYASLVKSFKALLDANWQSLFPEVPI